MYEKIKKENYDKIIEELKTLSQRNVAKKYNVSPSTISKIYKNSGIILRKNRLKNNKKYVDVDFFKCIDSDIKAYWLGYICADGCVHKNRCKLSLVSKDFEVIEKFKKDTKSNYKISTINSYDKRTKKTYIRYSIQITNLFFVENLINIGVDVDKSEHLEFPNINEEYYYSFIAGLFDGDGSVSIYRHYLKCNLISTKEVLEKIQHIFNTKMAYNKVTKKNLNVYKVCWYKDSYRILKCIYSKNPKMYLSRKYKIFKKYENNLPGF